MSNSLSHGLLVLAAFLAVALAAIYLVVGFANDVRRRVSRKLRRRCGDLVATVLFGSASAAAEAARQLSDRPDWMILDFAQRLSLDFHGDVNERLRELVGALGISRRIRSKIGSKSWRARSQGAALAPLLQIGDPLRTALVDDPHPVVRANAISALDEIGAADCVDALLEVLGSSDERLRLDAQQALLRGAIRIVPAIVEFLRTAEGMAAVLALEIAAKIPDGRLHEAAIPHARCGDPRRRTMAARALVNASVDPELLSDLLEDPESAVRAAGAAAVAASGAEVLASKVGRLLGDHAWMVRLESGAALAAMGPTGRLVLRSHLNDTDPFARDMALRTLDQLGTNGDHVVHPARTIDGIVGWRARSAAA